MTDEYSIFALVVLLIVLALVVVRLTSLLAVAILAGAMSFILATVYTLLDAVDVAFTEAVVGAGISLTLMLAAISLTTRHEAPWRGRPAERVVALLVSLASGAGLLYATLDMPLLGDPAAPANLHVAARYIAESPASTGVPNMVTAILASYRGYDTLGEVAVIFTAGVCVIALLRHWREGKA
ncbi:MAG: DUF4040 domain-containing protein [Alphaproteobacteria bacterium]|nr:DUF4040 domain-containing protein [Alphaproteobacteria bacterium]MCY4607325.1 DUF4040 domain-containing protein [bacterium]